MRYGLYLPNFGPFGDVAVLTRLARRADRNGWDGIFLWDHLVAPLPVADPWVALTAMAAATERISLGPLVVPLARRRPWQVAVAAATLQQVAGGRLVLGIGTGAARDFARFGEPATWRERTARLEEAVEIVGRLLAGEELTVAGRHYSLDRVRLTAADVPIWASGLWPRRHPIVGARQARGFFPVAMAQASTAAEPSDPRGRDIDSLIGAVRPMPADMAAFLARAIADGGRPDADLVLWTPEGPTDVDLDAYRAAGVTWWLQGEDGMSVADLERRIEAGPPRSSG